jgi:hypothetical protein
MAKDDRTPSHLGCALAHTRSNFLDGRRLSTTLVRTFSLTMIPPKLPSLPTFEISPVPEQIFPCTVKGSLSFVISLSLLDSSLIITIVLLVYANPSTRQKAAVLLGFLLQVLIFGLEVFFVDVYTLVCHLTPEIDE